jgi:universal stress protein A
MIARILVPVDFSPCSLQALDYAADLARPLRSEVLVLFVVEPVYAASSPTLFGSSVNLAMLIQEQTRLGREQLARATARVEAEGVKARPLLQQGSARQVIIDAARTVRADLIVMGTRGRSGLAHLLLGSVAEWVVRQAPCPVVTLRRYRRRRPARKSARRARSGK